MNRDANVEKLKDASSFFRGAREKETRWCWKPIYHNVYIYFIKIFPPSSQSVTALDVNVDIRRQCTLHTWYIHAGNAMCLLKTLVHDHNGKNYNSSRIKSNNSTEVVHLLAFKTFTHKIIYQKLKATTIQLSVFCRLVLTAVSIFPSPDESKNHLCAMHNSQYNNVYQCESPHVYGCD